MHSDKAAVIGDKDIVLAFKAVGMDVFPASTVEQAEAALKKHAKDHCVIFVTEDLAAGMKESLEKYKCKAYPTVIPIPSSSGTTGLGMSGIKADVERAVGTDILFNKED